MSILQTRVHEIMLDIGDVPILLRTDNPEFVRMVEQRYGPFANPQAGPAAMELDVRLLKSPDGWRWDEGLESRDLEVADESDGSDGELFADPDDDVKVRLESGLWTMERGDFRAEWDPATRRGWVQQTINPYSIDGVLRILHSLILAREGGLLLHAASAVRNGRAFVFAGVSGTGKTTISRLAPPDVKLLTDEISYIRENKVPGVRCQVSGGEGASQEPGVRCQNSEDVTSDSRFKIQDSESRIPNTEPLAPDTRHLTPAFTAFGTPFAGELARIGEKLKAPLAGIFLLKQGQENRIEPVCEGQAVRELMRHVLFFAHDKTLVNMVFDTVCGLVRGVPVERLVFKKDSSVWELIG